MDDVTETLSSLLERLEASIRQTRRHDAIDAILAGTTRTTQVASLRDHEVVRRFRQELSDGLIRVDTAHRLLTLLRTAIDAALT
ncbi:MAG: hypothetical protein JSU86_19820 [Phycisphaerales bacterium]|nr:MAG: hypothetical protein JSU86_19820 [Phycisphaerales bacterium]